MTEKVAYSTIRRAESHKPSADASSVGRWVIGTAILFSAFGFSFGAGIGWAAGLQFWGGLSLGLAAAGLVGFWIGVLRILTYDKKPYIDIKETTTEPVIYDADEEHPQAPPITGNTPINTAKPEGHTVTHNGETYEFTDTQINGMYTRVENEVMRLSRDAFGFGADYDMLMRIMGGLKFWRITQKAQKDGMKRSADWTSEGVEWLSTRMRGVK